MIVFYITFLLCIQNILTYNYERLHHQELLHDNQDHKTGFEQKLSELSRFRRQNGINWNTINRNPNRFQNDDDLFIFDAVDTNNDENGFLPPTPTTRRSITSTIAVPGMETTQSSCENNCRTTPEYNPVCGSDRRTYNSMSRLRCATNCGKRINFVHYGRCSRALSRR